MKFLLCGYGNIGKVLYPQYSCISRSFGTELEVYDPPLQNCPNKVNTLSTHYHCAFICVPTDKKADGSADYSIVLSLCKEIKADVIVIKSTIPLDVVPLLPDNVIFSPEYTGTTPHSGTHNYVVLGGKRELCNTVAQLYMRVNSADYEIVYTDMKTAIISKYMENCFLALKVTFCNEFAKACQMTGVEYDDVRNIFLKDSRFNPSHTYVYKDTPYYDSHCLNKDIPAFISQFNLPLMKAVDKINEDSKKNAKTKN